MTIYLIVLTAVLNQISFSGTRVAMTLYALELGASQFMVGVLIALFAVCQVLLSIPIGKFVDRTNPRLPLLSASALHIAMLFLPLIFPGLPALYVMAFILGISHSLFLIPIEATSGGIGGPGQRVRNYSLLTMGWSVANFLGPVVAGFSIDYLGFRSTFLVVMAIVIVPTLMLYFMPNLLPEPGKHAAKEKRGGSVLELWRMAPVRSTLITAVIIGSALDVFQFYFPIYGHAIALSASAIGIIIGMVAAAAFVIRGVIPLLMKKLREVYILTTAALIAAFAFALLPFFNNPYALAAIAFLLGLGVGCANPLTMSLLYVLTPPTRIAEALGLNKTFRSGSHMMVPLVFGSVGGTFGFMAVFLSNALLLTIGAALVGKAGIAVSPREQK